MAQTSRGSLSEGPSDLVTSAPLLVTRRITASNKKLLVTKNITKLCDYCLRRPDHPVPRIDQRLLQRPPRPSPQEPSKAKRQTRNTGPKKYTRRIKARMIEAR